jgi:hypothetical protein
MTWKMERRCCVVTGFWAEPDDDEKLQFLQLWLRNTCLVCDPASIIILNVSKIPLSQRYSNCIDIGHNLGHVRDLDRLPILQRPQLAGWSSGFLLGAMLAYSRNADYIYKEQDCLAFGPWLDGLYGELDSLEADMLVGRFEHRYQIEQSLTIVRHSFIPIVVQAYLAIELDDATLRPELKFLRIMNSHSERIRFFSFGAGRNRPIDFDAPIFYCQHLTSVEIEDLAARGLI